MPDPVTIWLAPICRRPAAEPCTYPDAIFDYGGERLWCSDDVWEPCPSCGAKPARYRLDTEPT